MSQISLLVPSRGRPKRFLEMWHSALKTAAEPSTLEVVIRCDNDDPTLQKYVKLLNNDKQIVFITAKRNPIHHKTYNECFLRSSSDILMACADDLIFETPEWDNAVKKQFESVEDKILFVFCYDGVKPVAKRFGTHGFLHRNWVNVVGYFIPPYFEADCGDVWLNELADRVNRKVMLSKYCIRHMHWYHYPNIKKDKTYKENIKRAQKYKVNQKYKQKKKTRDKDVKKIRDFIKSFNVK